LIRLNAKKTNIVMPTDDDTEQQFDENPAESDQLSGQSDEQPAEQADQPEQQAEEQPAEGDQPAEQTEETPADSDQPTEQAEEQPSESDQAAEQSGDATGQVADLTGEQVDGGDAAQNVADAGAQTDDVASAGGEDETAAEPARGGSTRLAPRKRLFRFVVSVDNSAVPDFIKNVFFPDPTDYFFGYAIAGAADPQPLHMIEDKWERVPVDGVMDFPYSTVEKKQFFIGVSIVPNSKVDPNASTSQALHRTGGVHTDDFSPMKATDAATLVKQYPDGVFILQINLVAFYIQIVDAGATTYEAELSKAKIPLEDVVYNALSPFTDASGKVVGTKHDVVYWSTDLHLSGRKYVP